MRNLHRLAAGLSEIARRVDTVTTCEIRLCVQEHIAGGYTEDASRVTSNGNNYGAAEAPASFRATPALVSSSGPDAGKGPAGPSDAMLCKDDWMVQRVRCLMEYLSESWRCLSHISFR